MALVRCPICGKRFDSSHSTWLPFCGERCRRIDLGRWLGEEYSLPVERPDDDDSQERDQTPEDSG